MKVLGGRKKNTLILLFILFLASLAAFLVLVPSSFEKQSPPQVTFTEEQSAPNIANTEDSASQQPRQDEQLQKIIQQWAANKPGEYGVMVREVNGNKRTAAYRPDEQMISASTYKLFLSYAVLKHVDKGIFELDSEVRPGLTITECIEQLLEVSTDECAWEMGDMIGWGNLDRFLYQQGFTGTQLNNYDRNGNFTTADKQSTARDEAEVAYRLATGTFLNNEYSDMLLSIMKKQIWRERIPAGVPENVEVANKPGWIYRMQNDTAIVYGEKSTYVLVIMSDGSSKQNLAELSEIIYEYLDK